MLEKNYRNYRWFYTSSGKLVVGGKSKEQNELVLRNFLNPKYIVVHTSETGSPFMIIQSENSNQQDIKEAAIFCACFSKSWKSAKKNEKINIHVFKGDQIYKTKDMKTGTFGVKGNIKSLKVKPELALVFQKNRLRAVPKTNKIKKEEILAEIKTGKLSKEEASEKILRIIKNKFNFQISKEEIMQVIPSDKLNVK